MIHFYEVSISLQILLLVLTLICIIVLEISCLYLFKQGCSIYKIILNIIMLLFVIIIFVLMMLDTSFGKISLKFCLPIPYWFVTLLIIIILFVNVFIIYKERQQVIMINNTSIKEAFDLLPIGICFFNETGLPILCNTSMYRFSSTVVGKDIQAIADLEGCLNNDFIPLEGVVRDGNLFMLKNGSTWYLEKRQFLYEDKYYYVEFIAYDVTVLHDRKLDLEREMKRLQGFRDKLYKLSANVVAVTKEEEILNTKMRVHDEMGRCLLLAQKCLTQECLEDKMNHIALSWQRAISMMKYHYDSDEKDMLLQVRKTCEALKISYIQNGDLPKQSKIAYIFTCAIRECVTNAVRYAKASELYVNFYQESIESSVMITNNGHLPTSEIVEGGGLSTLRKRVENAGGIMEIQSFPYFQLTVRLPITEGEIL